MPFHLTYYRYGSKHQETHDTLDEAVCSAAGGAEAGVFAYLHIHADDGTIVLEKDALSKAVGDKWEEWDRESLTPQTSARTDT